MTSGILEFETASRPFTCSTRAEDDQRSTSTARRAGSRSRSRSTSRPIDRPALHVAAGGDPPVAPATETLTFDVPTLHGRGRALRQGCPRRAAPFPVPPPTRSPTCASWRLLFASAEPAERDARRIDLERHRRPVGARQRTMPRPIATSPMSRATSIAIAIALVVAVVGAPGGSAVAPPARRADAPRPRRGSSTRRASAASTTATTASSSISSAAAWLSSTATPTGARTSTSPVASEPAALYRNRSAVGGALAFEDVPRPRHRPRGGDRAYPLDIDADGLARPRRAAVPARTSSCGPRRLPLRAGQRAWHVDGGERMDHGLQRHVGGGRGPADPRLRQLPRPGRDAARDRVRHDVLVRPDGDAYGEPITLAPGYCTLSMLFSDWDGPAGETCASATTGTTTRRAGAAVADRARRGTAAVDGARRAGSRCGSSAWGSPVAT